MLNKEDNQTLTRVGPGTVMGDFLRQYWQPILLTDELPEPDCAPLRVRLLGEDLIAVRTSSGKVGLLGNHCPHRGASLFFGRNEEEGLRCVYHGWKYDVDGNCVDMPNEPPESNFKHKIQHTAYPCQERAGLIWAYLGPQSPPPAIPDLEWTMVPDRHRYVSKRWQESNWAQSIEGGIDNSHASFLHSKLRINPQQSATSYMFNDRRPRFEAVDTDYGTMIVARREAGDDKYYWRVTQFYLPFYSMIPGFDPSGLSDGHAWVPIDDENTMTWSISWHTDRPLTEEEVTERKTYPTSGIHVGINGGFKPATSAPGGAWRTAPDFSNNFHLDYNLQKTEQFTGIINFGMQDSGIQVSMGPIYDRTHEHLGSSDTGIIRVRRRWLSSARALREQGTLPPAVNDPELFRARAVPIVLPKDVPWAGATEELRKSKVTPQSQ